MLEQLKITCLQKTGVFYSFLIIVAFALAVIGIFLISQAFFSKLLLQKKQHKPFIVIGCIGVVLLLFAGLSVIYFYALQPKPSTVDENPNNNEELPDISRK